MEWNKKNVLRGMGIIVFTILFYWVVNNWLTFLKLIEFVMELISPFVIGGAIAFVMNCPMRVMEEGMLKLKDTGAGKMIKAHRRSISLVFTILIFLGAVALLIFIVVPELVRTCSSLAVQVQKALEHYKDLLIASDKLSPAAIKQIQNLELDWEGFITKAGNWLAEGTGVVLGSTFSFASRVISSVVNTALAFIFAIYVLTQKETLASQLTKIIRAFSREGQSEKILKFFRLVNGSFSNFVSGQCIEAIIIAVMFFVGLSVFRFPYALVIAVLIGFTSLIPIFGAFIGLVIGAFLIGVLNPMQGIWFVVLFFVIQQIEGNLIYPKVVGGKVGLPSIWVLVAVTLGGNMMGLVGMLIFIPMFSVFYQLLRDATYARLEKKKS